MHHFTIPSGLLNLRKHKNQSPSLKLHKIPTLIIMVPFEKAKNGGRLLWPALGNSLKIMGRSALSL